MRMFIGNRKTKELHTLACTQGKRMYEKNKRIFHSISDALNCGYNGCAYCLPDYDESRLKKGDTVTQNEISEMEHIPGVTSTYQIKYKKFKKKQKLEIVPKKLYFSEKKMQKQIERGIFFADAVECVDKLGEAKNLLALKDPNAKLDIPLSDNIYPEFTATIRFKISSANDQNRQMSLMQGAAGIPIDLFLSIERTRIFPVIQFDLCAGSIVRELEEVSLKTDVWYSLSVVYTGSELDVIMNNSTHIMRYILPKNDAMHMRKTRNVIIGNGGKEQIAPFEGYLEDVEFNSTISKEHINIIKSAIDNGTDEIEKKYRDIYDRSFSKELISSGEIKPNGRYSHYKEVSIYWTRRIGAFAVVSKPILKRYQELGGPAGKLGYPIKDGSLNKQIFEYGAIYYDEQTGAHELSGDVLRKYISVEETAIGYPLYDKEELNNGFYRARFLMHSQNGSEYSDMYYSEETNVVLIRGGTFKDNIDRNLSIYGYPVSELRFLGKENCTDSSQSIDYCIHYVMSFQNGDLYCTFSCEQNTNIVTYTPLSALDKAIFLPAEFAREYNVKGGYKKCGMPTNFSADKQYCDCKNGTLLKYNGTYYFLSRISLHLVDAISYKIDDGWEFFPFKKDYNAELSFRLTLSTSGYRQRFGSEDCENKYFRGKRKTKDIRKEVTLDITGETKIYFLIKYSDYDRINDGEYLGTLERTYSIENLWGLTFDSTVNKLDGVYARTPLDHYGKDAYLCKYDTVLTNYAIHDLTEGEYIINKNTFRSECWWRFDNFKTNKPLSYQYVASVFRDMDYVCNWWDEVMNPIDSIFYYAVRKCAKQGNCFGMCLAALSIAKRDNKTYTLPLKEYKANDEDSEFLQSDTEFTKPIKDVIKSCHLYEWGAYSLKNMVNAITRGDIRHPARVFRSVERHVEKDGFSIITFMNIASGFSGHAVLAYKTERVSNDDWRIYVADPNFSSRRSVDINGEKEKEFINWISVNPRKDTFHYFKPNKDENGYKKDSDYRSTDHLFLDILGFGNWDGFMFETPYNVVKERPLTPSLYFLRSLFNGKLILALFSLFEPRGVTFLFECIQSGVSIIPLSFVSGNMDNSSMYLILGDERSYELKLKGEESGSFIQQIETLNSFIEIQSTLQANGICTIILNDIDTDYPEIRIKSTEREADVKIKRTEKRYKNNLRVIDEVTMKVDCDSFAKYQIDRITGKTVLFQGISQNIIGLNRTYISNHISNNVYMPIKPTHKNEEITLKYTGEHLKSDIVIEKKDALSGKLYSRIVGEFLVK